MAFRFSRLEIPDVVLVVPPNHLDERGWFRETYKRSEFAAHGIADPFVQDNASFSSRGVLRGLHYQKPPRAQAKLVSVSLGEILDVAVDIRKGSPTFSRWVSGVLSAENGHMLYIPPGFAHGFCVLSAHAALNYKVTQEYAPDLERGVRWNDPDLAISWHIETPLVSPRDAQLPLLREADNPFDFEKSRGEDGRF